MPKYSSDVVAGYILYFTSRCTIEAMHVHASEKEMSELYSAKLFVYEDGETKVERKGPVNDVDMRIIRTYIKHNHEIMYRKWRKYSDNGYCRKRN